MSTRTMKDTDINIDNVDDAIEKAICHYFDNHLLVDGLFWRQCINLLKRKSAEKDQRIKDLVYSIKKLKINQNIRGSMVYETVLEELFSQIEEN